MVKRVVWVRSVVVPVVVVVVSLLVAVGVVAAPSTPVFGDIDQARHGSIIIHKHERQNGTNALAQPDGSASIPSAGIGGVEFTVYPVAGLDMSNPRTWDMVAGWSAPGFVDDSNAAGVRLGTVPDQHGLDVAGKKQVVTDASGVAVVSGLPVGLYVVAETKRPANVVDIAQPFIVSIPFPDTGKTQGWLYEVNVYPKNGVGSIDKTISKQTGLGLGAVVVFPVTVTVPTIAENASFSYYIIHDPMDARLTGTGVQSVQVDGVDVPARYYHTSVTGSTVDVGFTQEGLGWLKTQAGKSVVVTFTGVVGSLGVDGVITNKAFLYSNTQTSADPPVTPPLVPPANPPSTPPESGQVHENWGNVVVSKIDAGDHHTGLSGAQFEVYGVQDPYASDCSHAQVTGDALRVNGVSRFTSGADGRVVIDGLFVSDSKNTPVDATSRCYVLKEVVAPAGYVLPTGAAALTPVSVKTGNTQGVDVTIVNSKNTMPPLPLTGATGLVVLTLTGVVLLVLAVVVLVYRRNHHE